MAKRTILGKNNQNNYGLYISKTGVDVDTASLPEHYAFNSDWVTGCVIHASGTMSMGSTIYFPTLPYIPLVMSWGVWMNGNQAGRVHQVFSYDEVWQHPDDISEVRIDTNVQTYSGPMLTTGYSHVTFNNYEVMDGFHQTIRPFNARYIVLRVPVN